MTTKKTSKRKAGVVHTAPATLEEKADAYLEQRGSSLADAETNGSEVLTAEEMTRRGFRRQFAAPAITFPCLDPLTGAVLNQGRARYLEKVIDDEGKERKFNAAYGQEPLPYIALDFSGVAKDTSIDIHITEGETRALALAPHGVYCITLGGVDAGFVKGSKRGELIPWFKKIRWKGRRVYISYDADAANNPDVREARRRLAMLLRALGAIVYIVDIPPLFGPHTGTDDICGAGGFGVYMALCRKAKEFSEENEWLEPKPFLNALPPVPTMTASMVPEPLRDWVVDEAERMGVPLEYIAVSAVFALSIVTMTRCGMKPKDKDSWTVWGIVWFLLVASSGSKKTAAFKAGMQFVYAIEKKLREAHSTSKHQHKAMRKYYESVMADWEKKAIEAQQNGKPMPPAPAIAEVPKDPPPPPALVANSATTEALQEHMKRTHSPGIGLIRDEMAGLIEECEKPGREGERAFLIEGIEANAYTSFRIGRGETIVPKNAIAIGGTIQPPRLLGLVQAGLNNTSSNDGLLPRFGLALYPDPRPEEAIEFVNRLPDLEARARAFKVYEKIHALDHKQPIVYTFDAAAQKLYAEWYVGAEKWRRSADVPEIVISHFSKYDGWIPALAMLIKLVDKYDSGDQSNMVESKHLRLALRWARFLAAHARRIYAARMSPARTAALTLAEKIQRGRLTTTDGVFTLRDVYDNDWVGLATPDEARAAIKILADYGWAREVQTADSKRGRPSERYALNPRVTSTYPEVNATKAQIDENGGESSAPFCGLPPSAFQFCEGEEEEEMSLPSTLKKGQKSRPKSQPAKPTKMVRPPKYTLEGRTAQHKSTGVRAAKRR